MLAHFIEECPEWTAPNGDITLQGMSIGGLRTGFICKRKLDGIMLDAGVHTRAPVRASEIFVTHVHTDHTHAIAENQIGVKTQTNIYMPTEAFPLINEYMRIATSMTVGEMIDIDKYHDIMTGSHEKRIAFKDATIESDDILKLKTVVAGDIIKLDKKNICVYVDNVYHLVPAIAYSFVEKQRKLKDEYNGLTSDALAKLLSEGHVVTEEQDVCLLSYLGDTIVKGFIEIVEKRHPKICMVECTFPSDKDKAHKYGHTCFEDLIPTIKNNPDTYFLIIHFSSRLSTGEIIDFMTKTKATGIVLSNLSYYVREKGFIEY